MKQTAVEWLENNLKSHFEHDGDLLEVVQMSFEQAKEMEGEQMIKFAEFVATYPDKNRNVNGEMLHAKSKYDSTERTIDLLEIFKKK